jgi:hypothetical protein
MSADCFKTDHDHFLPHVFQFTIHYYSVTGPYNLQRDLTRASLNKLQINKYYFHYPYILDLIHSKRP